VPLTCHEQVIAGFTMNRRCYQFMLISVWPRTGSGRNLTSLKSRFYTVS
jgi:hypothetical protein